MFGSTLVEGYIGELWLASQADGLMKDDGGILQGISDDMPEEEQNAILQQRIQENNAKNELIQRRRQVKIAQFLRKRVESYDATNADAFAVACRQEAANILSGAYGGSYLHVIGWSLEIAAEQYIGYANSFLGIGGLVASTRKSASGVRSNFQLLGAGIKAATAGSRAMVEAEELQKNAQERGDVVSDEDAQKLMGRHLDESLPAFLDLAWAVNKRDIQTTLKAACRKLFDDASVPKEMRLVRARAIRILGREFRTMAGKKPSDTQTLHQPEELKARIAVATMTTMAKAQGQEISEEDMNEMMEHAKREMMMVNQQQQNDPEDGPDVDGNDAK
jgi:hypothetical protein